MVKFLSIYNFFQLPALHNKESFNLVQVILNIDKTIDQYGQHAQLHSLFLFYELTGPDGLYP